MRLLEWCDQFETDDPVSVPADLGGGVVRPISYRLAAREMGTKIAEDWISRSPFLQALLRSPTGYGG